MTVKDFSSIYQIFHHGGYVVFFAIAFFVVTFLVKYVLVQLYTFIADYKLKEQNYLLDLVSNDHISDDMKFHANDILEQKIFGKFSGIHGSTPEQRAGLIKLYKTLTPKYSWVDVSKSARYIEFDSSLNRTFKHTRWDKIEFWYANIAGVASLLFCIWILVLAAYALMHNKESAFFVLMFAGVAIAFLSALISLSVYGYKKSHEIKKYLEQIESSKVNIDLSVQEIE